MKNNQLWSVLIVSILLVFSIKASSKEFYIYGVSSESVPTNDEYFVFENDTLIIAYDFWSNRGCMSFAIKNKLNTPIYINWKKSGFVSSNFEVLYSKEFSSTKPFDPNSYIEAKFKKPNINLKSFGKNNDFTIIHSDEDITEISPNSVIYKNCNLINPAGYDLSTSDYYKENYDEESFYIYNYSFQNTIDKFVNYISYSAGKELNEENIILNSFYIKSIIEFSTSKHKGSSILENLKNPKSFYFISK